MFKKLLALSIAAVVILAIAGWKLYSTSTLHRPLNIDEISRITLLGGWVGETGWVSSNREATEQEVKNIVNWFNSADGIRHNRDFAGTTAESSMRVELNNGEKFSIIRSGQDFEVQRKDQRGEPQSYWAKQKEIKNLLNELAGYDSSGNRIYGTYNSTEQLQEKGYENIAKIEITKYSYNPEQGYESKRIEKTIAIEIGLDIRWFMEIFNSKELSLATFDIKPLNYQVDIVRKDGPREIYDFALSESQVFFRQNGKGYFVNDSKSAAELKKLLVTYQI